MKYSETGFRAVYHNFVAVTKNRNIEALMDSLPGGDLANGVLAYGYYDRDAGMTLEVMAAAYVTEDGFKVCPDIPDASLKIRIGAIEDTEFYIVNDEEGYFANKFADKLKILKGYDASEEIEQTRGMFFLDPCRDKEYIDDVLVRLMQDGLLTEGCWTRITGIGEHWFMGTLLNEPVQDFGWHKGDEIAFFINQDEDETYCYSDMNPTKWVTPEELEDGSMLKEAVARFNSDRTEPNFIDVLEILRDSFVWVPCSAILSEADQERVLKMLEEAGDDPSKIVGDEFITGDSIRLVPDILQNGDSFYFPIFSSEEEMGEYGKNFSKIQKHIFEVIPLARNNDHNVAGIVLNAFSDPFVLDAQIFDIVEKMKSRIRKS